MTVVKLSLSHSYTCGAEMTPACCAAPVKLYKLPMRPRGTHLPINCSGRFAYGHWSDAHRPPCSNSVHVCVCVCVCVCVVSEVARQVGLHQCTGSCDCGRFVIGCACVCLCGMCGHNLSVEVKICHACLSKCVCLLVLPLCVFAQDWRWLNCLTNREGSRWQLH